MPQEADDPIRHVQTTCHATHRREIHRLCALARKVERFRADHPKAPLGLADLLRQTWGELDGRARKEEQRFPSMPRGAARIDRPLAKMRADNACQTARLRRIARLTRGFTPPEGACPDWWALYAMTFSFVDDVEQHLRLEDEVLSARYQRGQA